MIIKSNYSNSPVWRDIHVHAVLPPELQPLEEISHNLWWVWNEEVKAILETLDTEEWEKSGKNPVVMLQNLRSDITERLVNDKPLVERIQRVYAQFKEYMNVPYNTERPSIAYFSMEYGLSHVLKIYSGGLGVLAELIKREIRDVRIAIGHGQMDPKKLEGVISDFMNHEQDILIATTIIESGIDMPNVNTIIVIDAQNFGLSDLHQLRGRVGRSNRKAFCYLLAPPLYTLSGDSRRRLQAIENFSELGSGLHIAMQDLDIRGAGNLLGAEQSGFIADLGYETYRKILAEAVQELRKEEFSDLYNEELSEKAKDEDFVDDVHVESDLELMFPVTYIPNDAERVAIYRELDNMETELEILDFIERMEDRFGKMPKQGKELIRIVRLRRLARPLGIEKIMLKNGKMSLNLVSDSESPYYQSAAFGKLLNYVQVHPRNCKLREAGKKRSLVIDNVKTVETAVATLEEISGYNISN
jgi:transcription-repair coupling factor (superfamily II helicase)